MADHQDVDAARLRRHLLLLLTVSLFAGVLLAGIAEGGRPRFIDAWAVTHANQAVVHHRALLSGTRFVTGLGSPEVVDGVVILVAIVLVLLRRRNEAMALIVTRVLTGAAVDLLKLAIARPRPLLLHPVAHASGFSLPSGHAAGAASCYLPIAVIIALRLRSRIGRAAVIGAAIIMCVLVAASRVMLGVHYPTDVVAGLALAVGITQAVFALTRS